MSGEAGFWLALFCVWVVGGGIYLILEWAEQPGEDDDFDF